MAAGATPVLRAQQLGNGGGRGLFGGAENTHPAATEDGCAPRQIFQTGANRWTSQPRESANLSRAAVSNAMVDKPPATAKLWAASENLYEGYLANERVAG